MAGSVGDNCEDGPTYLIIVKEAIQNIPRRAITVKRAIEARNETRHASCLCGDDAEKDLRDHYYLIFPEPKDGILLAFQFRC
jgi:hypothetical protein